MIEGHIRLDTEFDKEAAITLCNRGVEKVDTGGYKFTRDLRAKIVSQIVRHFVVIRSYSSHSVMTLKF